MNVGNSRISARDSIVVLTHMRGLLLLHLHLWFPTTYKSRRGIVGSRFLSHDYLAELREVKAMKPEEIDAFADGAKCPEFFPKDLNIGPWLIGDDRSNHLVKFDPQSTNCDAFSSIHEIKDTSEIFCHSHGIKIHVGNIEYNIHNSQIIIMEAWRFDDTISYNRSDSRAARIGMGVLLGGPIVGAALGLASSFGRGKKHIVTDILEIYFWDVDTKQKQWISLQYGKDVSAYELMSFVEFWKEQKRINEETGRKAIGEERSGISPNSGGCLGSIIVALAGATAIGLLCSFI